MAPDSESIYLDHHATTPMAEEVLRAMMPYFTSNFGNASSIHPYGWKAKEAVEEARREVAKLINAKPGDIYFTSGATESNNMALFGLLAQMELPGPYHIVTSRIEHKAILEPCKELIKRGHSVTFLEPDSSGTISPQLVQKAIRQETVLISIHAANNEIGTIQKITDIGRIARDNHIVFHTDATQYVPYVSLDVNRQMIDILSLSAHKMNGPKGVGAIFVRSMNPRVRINPVLLGSGQEKGLRPGTVNVPGVVGLGAAAKLVMERRSSEFERLRNLRDKLEDSLMSLGCQFNGDKENRLPNNMSVTFDDLEASEILKLAKDLCVSQGAACHSTNDISHVLAAVGLSEKQARGTLRFGLGLTNTEADIERASKSLRNAVLTLRSGQKAL